MSGDIKRYFFKLLVNTLDTAQINHLGEKIDSRFNVYEESGFFNKTPLPRKTAAETLLNRFSSDEEIVELFTILLNNEGERFYNATLTIWGKEDFLKILKRHKWVYDPDLRRFSLDPFYEQEINLLKKIRFIDLRHAVKVHEIIKEIKEATSRLGIRDLEWRISLRLYDLDNDTGELIRSIIRLLLARQNLEVLADELFFCLKELAINATKANYKILFEKHITRGEGIDADREYHHFLKLFKKEIDTNGNRRLLELARIHDKFITITFQSTLSTIEIWVTNSENISLIEKQAILEKVRGKGFKPEHILNNDDEYSEGAGFGLRMILSVLRSYTTEKEPLKVVFYPDFVKIGFILGRSDLAAKVKEKASLSSI